MACVIKYCLVLLRNSVNKPVAYINMWLFSLNIFKEKRFMRQTKRE